jgi:hypothetical protein
VVVRVTLTSGPELVQTAVARQIKQRLDAEIARQSAEWDVIDKQTSSWLGIEHRRTIIEAIKPESFLLGERPSVIEMPWDFFPSLNVNAFDTAASSDSRRMDAGLAYSVPFYVEVIVASDIFPSDDSYERVFQQGVVDRRAKRTADAVIQCLQADLSLGGICSESDMGIRSRQTPPFAMRGRERDESNHSCIFSLVRIDASVEVYASLPGVDQRVSALLPVGVGLGN